MIIYQILIEKQVQKRLARIPEPDYTRIKNAIMALATNPRPTDSKKLKGRTSYRIRQGNYRIIYEINDSILTVFVLDAGHRKDIYE